MSCPTLSTCATGICRARRLIQVALLCVLSLAAVPGSADSEAEQRARLKALKESIESLRKELHNVKSDRSELLKALEESEKSIGELSSQVEKLNRQLKKEEKDLNQLRDRQSSLEKDKSAQQKHVAEQINAAYRLGQQSGLRLLLNQQDPALVARNMKHFNYIARARTEKIDHYVATLAELRQVEEQIVAQTAQLQQSRDRLQQRHKQLASQQSQRRSTLDKLEAVIANKDDELQELQKDEQRLERVLAQVAQALGDIKLPADAGDFATLKGQLPWPIQGQVVKQFGSARVAGKVNWQGMVIHAEAGTPVRAIHHGRVVFSDYLRGHGLLLIVDHGTGFMSLYAHNQALYKEIGEWVDSGDVIASVGNSGGQKNAGLYFELRHKGRPTDPRQWIKTT